VESNSGHTKLCHLREGLDAVKHADGAAGSGKIYYEGESVICNAICFQVLFFVPISLYSKPIVRLVFNSKHDLKAVFVM
jgi:hypothetical protein